MKELFTSCGDIFTLRTVDGLFFAQPLNI